MRIRPRIAPLPLFLVLACAAPGPDGPATEDRRYLLERVGDAAIVQLYADGFANLTPDEQLLAYHLSNAAIAGRDIYLHQRYRHALDIRDVFEEILTHAEGVDPDTLARIRHYAKLFWINNGPHQNLTTRKFAPACTPEAWSVAAHAAQRAGARFPLAEGEDLDDLLSRLEGPVFDLTLDASVTNKSPGPGQDMLLASANTFYEGVSLADLEGFTEAYPLNSTLTKTQAGIEEVVWRMGDGADIPPGRYADAIAEVVGHLEKAIEVAPAPTQEALTHLVRYYRTGDPEDFRLYNIAWVADSETTVDTINGFIEVYVDPRGQKGAWEALVYYTDPTVARQGSILAENAQWFEDRMPSDPAFRKDNVTGISYRAIEVLVETGDSGPITPIGINLPNDNQIRANHGSKAVSLANVLKAYEGASGGKSIGEFAWDEEEAARSRSHGGEAGDLSTTMHEVLGHASGRMSADLTGVEPSTLVGEYYSALEEARADLVALYYIGDPMLAELGVADDPAALQRAEYESYARNALLQLRRVPADQDQLEDDHMRNRQMVVHWLMAHTDAIERRERDAKTFFVVVDMEAFREGVGRLLAEVQRIKSTGDRDAARHLMETYAIPVDTALRDEVLARSKALDLASYTGFVMPELEATDSGFTVTYPLDLETQMLGWSGRLPSGR